MHRHGPQQPFVQPRLMIVYLSPPRILKCYLGTTHEEKLSRNRRNPNQRRTTNVVPSLKDKPYEALSLPSLHGGRRRGDSQCLPDEQTSALSLPSWSYIGFSMTQWWLSLVPMIIAGLAHSCSTRRRHTRRTSVSWEYR